MSSDSQEVKRKERPALVPFSVQCPVIEVMGGSVDSGTGLNLETQNLKITNKFTIHACLKLIKLKKYILVRSKLNFLTFSHFYIFFCLSFI